jgi:hypothetical protein
MRTGLYVSLMLLAGNAAAQIPTTPQLDPKNATGHGSAPQQSTAPSRNQFFSPVMGIQIEAQGLTLPKGVADDPLAPPTAPQPAAEQKPPEQPPATQK